MALAVLYSRALAGMEAPLVTVEVHLSNGLPSFNLVGLPEVEVKESKDRVRSALLNAQFEFPAHGLPSTWHPPTFPRRAAASTCRSRSASWRHPGRFPRMIWCSTSLPANLP